MYLNFPTNFIIDYPKINYKFYDEGVVIKNILLNSSNYYCMYCGKRLKISNETEANIEHTLEKSNANKYSFLRNCKFNFSITCPTCNQIYKSKMIEKIECENLKSYDIKCYGRKCEKRCDEINNLMIEYLNKNKIIIQPSGVTNHLLKSQNQKFDIQYSFFKEIMQPAIYDVNNNKLNYTPKDLEFISEHIARFHLNSERFPEIIVKRCEGILKVLKKWPSFTKEEILELVNSFREHNYDNIIEKNFFIFLKNDLKDKASLKDFCELIILLSFL